MQIVLNNYLTNAVEVIEVSNSEVLPKRSSYHTALESYVASKISQNLEGQKSTHVRLTSKGKSYVFCGEEKIGDVILKLTGKVSG